MPADEEGAWTRLAVRVLRLIVRGASWLTPDILDDSDARSVFARFRRVAAILRQELAGFVDALIEAEVDELPDLHQDIALALALLSPHHVVAEKKVRQPFCRCLQGR